MNVGTGCNYCRAASATTVTRNGTCPRCGRDLREEIRAARRSYREREAQAERIAVLIFGYRTLLQIGTPVAGMVVSEIRAAVERLAALEDEKVTRP